MGATLFDPDFLMLDEPSKQLNAARVGLRGCGGNYTFHEMIRCRAIHSAVVVGVAQRRVAQLDAVALPWAPPPLACIDLIPTGLDAYTVTQPGC